MSERSSLLVLRDHKDPSGVSDTPNAALVRRSCLSPGCLNEVEPGELDCETHRGAADLNYEHVAQIVTEAFNRYHRGEHSDPVFIEHDIAEGIVLERRRLRGRN